LSYIGNKPANKAVVASDLDPAVITGQTALATSPADTDEFLISDAGVLKRLDASLIGGGKLLQVVSTTKTDTYSESLSAYAEGSSNVTGLEATITPTSASSKLLVFSAVNTSRSGDSASGGFAFFRDGSRVLSGASPSSRLAVAVGHFHIAGSTFSANSFMFGQVDASSTSETTFGIRLNNSGSSTTRTFNLNKSNGDTDNSNHTRSISSIMVMEISA
jgi:hypothetical protein